ncbi:hypothetical protein Tco_1381742 [Tanacetum coccineum]
MYNDNILTNPVERGRGRGRGRGREREEGRGEAGGERRGGMNFVLCLIEGIAIWATAGPLGTELFEKEQDDLLSDLKDIPKKACDRRSEIEVDRAKVDVIAKLPHPTTVKGVRSFDDDGFSAIPIAPKKIASCPLPMGLSFTWEWIRPLRSAAELQELCSLISNLYLFNDQDMVDEKQGNNQELLLVMS